MESDIRKRAEKYFRGECTHGEARQVLDWFHTAEGEKYLDDRLERDLNRIDEFPDLEIYRKVPTSRIRNRLEKARKQVADKAVRSNMHKRHSRYSGAFATAASLILLVAASVSLFYYSTGSGNSVQPQQQEISYSIGAEEHKILSLSDGSVVRLNSNSQLTVPEVFRGDSREVTLEGEAYFEINSNPEKPFVVHTDQATIKVLGTAFNVKESLNTQNVQVAVKEGKVSFQQRNASTPQEVVLVKNQLAYIDAENNEIKVEQVEIDNYLSWMTRRLVFNHTPFLKVCDQLESIYDISCSVRDKELAEIYFSANFERRSLEKTLEVIANSLDISYRMEEDRVVWMIN